MEQEHARAPGAGPGAGAPISADETFSPGEVVNGQYAVMAPISEGRTGTLYRAQDVKTLSELTLKLLHGWAEPDRMLLTRVKEELSLTRTLARPAIAKVYGCDRTADGRTFVALERMEGRNLADLIQSREPLSVERALDLTVQVARGLHAAHGVRLFHGAVDAEHVLVQPDDVVKVLGFEVARFEAANRANRSSERPDVVTAGTDTRAVGMMLLQMLTAGVRPGPDGMSTHPDAPRGGEVPPEIKQIIMRALVTAPGPSSLDMGGLATALLEELRRRREPIPPRASKSLRRRSYRAPWTLAGGRVGAIAGIALAGLVAWSFVGSPRSRATHEGPPDSAGRKAPGLASTSLDATAPPRSGDGVGAPPPVVRPVGPSGDAVPSAPAPPPAPPAADRPAVEALPPSVPPPEPVAPPAPVARRAAAVPPTSVVLPPPAALMAPAAPARPPETAARAPGGGSAAAESDTPDPSAIIDWLLTTRGSQAGQP
jgi:serine/threonine-protein kinase